MFPLRVQQFVRGPGAGCAAALVIVACAGCAANRKAVIDLRAPSEVAPIEQSVFLIGDAGEPAKGGEPVLAALTRAINRTGGPATVIFLGDNIYHKGLPRAGAEDRRMMERRLRDQIDAVLSTQATAIFIPGNHDWARGRSDGWKAVLRQQEFIDSFGTDRIRLLPEDGCPGPRIVDRGRRVRIVAIDTQWWLHKNEKPRGGADCPATEAAVLDSLRGTLRSAGNRHVIVAAHHPPLSSGPHGGYFTWQDHIFPFTAAASWAWLPLPVVGSIYPLSRMLGITNQDLSGGRNEHMREALDSVFREEPPLVFAAGHEHVLEVYRGESARYVLVSGSGIYDHTEPIGRREGQLWAASEAGFMKLDFLEDGAVRLGVITVYGAGRETETFSCMLD